jgi:hypothetical protein
MTIRRVGMLLLAALWVAGASTSIADEKKPDVEKKSNFDAKAWDPMDGVIKLQAQGGLVDVCLRHPKICEDEPAEAPKPTPTPDPKTGPKGQPPGTSGPPVRRPPVEKM